MRARLALLGVIAIVGCTRDNPAFDDPADTEATTADSVDTDPTSAEGMEAPDPECLLEGGESMVIELVLPCDSGLDNDPKTYDKWHNVVELNGSTLGVGICQDSTCMECADAFPQPLKLEPLPLSNLVVEGDCLHVVGRRAEPQTPASCVFQTVAIEVMTGQGRQTIAIARNASVVDLPTLDANSGPMVSGFDPSLVVGESCPCTMYPDDCCDGVAPTVYDFNVGLPEPVSIGQNAIVHLDGRDFEFWGLDAFQPGECGEPLRVSWGLTVAL